MSEHLQVNRGAPLDVGDEELVLYVDVVPGGEDRLHHGGLHAVLRQVLARRPGGAAPQHLGDRWEMAGDRSCTWQVTPCLPLVPRREGGTWSPGPGYPLDTWSPGAGAGAGDQVSLDTWPPGRQSPGHQELVTRGELQLLGLEVVPPLDEVPGVGGLAHTF